MFRAGRVVFPGGMPGWKNHFTALFFNSNIPKIAPTYTKSICYVWTFLGHPVLKRKKPVRFFNRRVSLLPPPNRASTHVYFNTRCHVPDTTPYIYYFRCSKLSNSLIHVFHWWNVSTTVSSCFALNSRVSACMVA